uniref:Uncharacterized protein n=1 Tax=Micrococcus phage Kurnik TaxID=3092208 RepID=A0AAU6R5I3_9CAUD
MNTIPVEETNLPRVVRYRGRRVRVLEYLPKNRFVILDSTDSRRIVGRADIAFVRKAKR